MALIALLPSALSAARLSLRDGSVINGQFISGTSQEIVFQDDNGVRRRFNLNQVLNIDFSSISQTVAPDTRNRMDERRRGNDWTVLPEGTSLSVRTEQAIGPENAADGSTFPVSIVQDVLDSTGNVVIPRDSEATLIVRRAMESGRYALDLESIEVHGRRYIVNTVDARGNAGPALGTFLGGVAGGGKTAAIGAGVQVATQGKEIRAPAETILNFRLEEPLHLRER
jgi:hypothetical protein